MKIVPFLFLCLFLLSGFIPTSLLAQHNQIDSLKQILIITREDTNKLKILNKIADKLWRTGNYDTAMLFSHKALTLANALPLSKCRQTEIAFAYNSTGVINYYRGNYPEALKYYFLALKIKEELGDKKGVASSYGNIGLIYLDQNNLSEALKNHLSCLKIMKEIGNKKGMALSYGNVGLVFADQDNYPEALKNHFASLAIMKEINDKNGIARSYNNIGIIYFDQAKRQKNKDSVKIKLTDALNNHLAALKIREEIGDIQGVSRSCENLGATYKELRNYTQAEAYELRALQIAQRIVFLDGIKDAQKDLSDIYSAMGKDKEALKYYKDYIIARDSLNNTENAKKTVRLQMNFEFDKKEAATKLDQGKRDIIAAEDSRKQKIIIYAVSAGMLLIFILAVVILRSLRINQKKNRIISIQKQAVEKQKHMVEEKHKEITDSINYAERIQRSFLATKTLLDENLHDYFVFFRPKDIVSGDFYWASKLSNHQFALATADSTGHGVPGAIMSILNISSLENAVRDVLYEPSQILNHTRINIIERLRKDGSAEGGKDGMDCSLISFDFKNRKLTYASANNPVLIVRGKDILELAPDKMPIGKHDKDTIPFSQHTVEMEKGDVVYAITDGMSDQFGGPNGKKFMYKQLKELLISIADSPMDIQKEKLESALNDWKGNLEQVDDITIIGVRI
jgi:serine phosphatase RsbU (regulator of sigma subunit)/tetratricopeptide (TPR) repeat protein